MYHLSFERTEEQYVRFNQYHLFRKSQTLRKRLRVMRILTFIVAALWFFLAFLKIAYTEQKATGWIFLAIAVFLLAFSLWNYSKGRINRNIQKNVHRLCVNGSYRLGTVELCFEEDSFREQDSQTRSENRYSSLRDICDDGVLLYLYQSETTAFIIPVGAFRSMEEKDAFLKFLSEKTNLSVQ